VPDTSDCKSYWYFKKYSLLAPWGEQAVFIEENTTVLVRVGRMAVGLQSSPGPGVLKWLLPPRALRSLGGEN